LQRNLENDSKMPINLEQFDKPSFLKLLLVAIVACTMLSVPSVLAHDGHNHDHHNHNHNHAHSHAHDTHKAGAGHSEEPAKLDLSDIIFGHIADANNFHVAGSFGIPLPCIVYHNTKGFDFFMSSVFHHGHESYNGYVLDHHGRLYSVDDANFPTAQAAQVHVHKTAVDGVMDVAVGKNHFKASRSNFYDFSITKVVFTLLLTVFLLWLIFSAVARGYKRNEGKAPSGIQSLMEPIILFVRDDIAKACIGEKKYEKFVPFLLSAFFFIWIGNLLGLIPFFPGSGNATGNIAVTLTLATFTFLLTNLNGTKDYWSHLFNPPGVPFPINIILIIIEVLSVFIKPVALMIRLFANITAGHIIILSLTCLIFIFAEMAGTAGGAGVSVVSMAFMIFMNLLELLVAALQAYIFTILSAVFIGQAVEEHDHHHEGAHH